MEHHNNKNKNTIKNGLIIGYNSGAKIKEIPKYSKKKKKTISIFFLQLVFLIFNIKSLLE